jgi:hypothetical protein
MPPEGEIEWQGGTSRKTSSASGGRNCTLARHLAGPIWTDVAEQMVEYIDIKNHGFK